MFKAITNENLFVESTNRLTKTEKLIILIFGIISGTAGVYVAWLDIAGRYMEMGLFFFGWMILQIPVYIVASLALSLFGSYNLIYYFLTFSWWFFLGSLLGFVLIFLKNYFDDIYIE